MFLYADKLCQQRDGVATECPLAPTMANFLSGPKETKMLGKQTLDHTKMYDRYMDDIFEVLNNDNASMSFLEVLNDYSTYKHIIHD